MMLSITYLLLHYVPYVRPGDRSSLRRTRPGCCATRIRDRRQAVAKPDGQGCRSCKRSRTGPCETRFHSAPSSILHYRSDVASNSARIVAGVRNNRA
ncbi:hypothetical protein [Frankia sp. CcWB3]